MAVAFVQNLTGAQSKTADTSLNIIPFEGTTVTAGNDIFVAFASDDVGTAHSVDDSLGNIYTLEKEQVNAGSVKSQLWRATNITGGTLNQITISWTTNVTAKAAFAGEFSGVGTRDGTGGGVGGGLIAADQANWQTDDLVIGAGGFEGPTEDTHDVSQSGTTLGTLTEVGQRGTTGGGAASNITVTLSFGIATANASTFDHTLISSSAGRDAAGAGAVYSPAAPAVAQPRHSAINHQNPAVL